MGMISWIVSSDLLPGWREKEFKDLKVNILLSPSNNWEALEDERADRQPLPSDKESDTNTMCNRKGPKIQQLISQQKKLSSGWNESLRIYSGQWAELGVEFR